MLAKFKALSAAILACLCIGGQPAAAWPAHGGGGGGGGGYTGPGDVVAGATAFWGFRAYSAAIAAAGTQKIAKLVRASDSMACDVLVASNGGLGNTVNTGGCTVGVSVATFCASTTCKVDTLYDQVGGFNATQSTDASRPVLSLSCIGSLPCMQFAGAQGMATALTTINQALTITAVAERTGSFGSTQWLLAFNNGPVWGLANQFEGYYGAGPPSVTASDSVFHFLANVANGTSGVITVDATDNTSLNMGAGALTANVHIGENGSSSNPLTGNVSEIGVWASGFTTGAGNQTQLMCGNAHTYWGTATSC